MKLIALVLSVVLVSPAFVQAADYTPDGRVDLSTAGYNGPGFSGGEVAYLMGSEFLFLTAGLFDWPLGKMPTLAIVAASVIGWGAYRTNYWRGSDYDMDKGGSAHMVVESGTVREL